MIAKVYPEISDIEDELSEIKEEINEKVDELKDVKDQSEKDTEKVKGRSGRSLLEEKVFEFSIELIDKYSILSMKDNGEIMVYYDGCYHIKGNTQVDYESAIFFEREYSPQVKSLINNHIVCRRYSDREEFVPPKELINCKNGVLNLKTKEFLKHSPDYNFLSVMNAKYDKDVDCPEIKKMLSQITKNEDEFLCLQEFCGYCLTQDYTYRKLLVIYGDTGAGKSTFVKLLIDLFGKSNISSESMQQLSDDQFSPINLYGKTINICDDLPATRLNDDGQLKKLTGGSTMTGNRKFLGNFNFVSHAKLIFTCNNLPVIPNTGSDAFWSRLILLEFPNRFPDDLTIVEKISTEQEMSGFLNFCIEGLERLRKNKTFTQDNDDAVDRWLELSLKQNPITQFYSDCVAESSEETISWESLFDAYEFYCNKHNRVPMEKVGYKKFNRLIRDQGIVDFRPALEDGKQVRCWKGISLKSEFAEWMLRKQNNK